MADFWNSLLTEKSWSILIKISKEPFKFIVIGGWATYLWTKQHKSKDIDIALVDIKQIDYLKNNYNLNKNEDLRKYEIKFSEIDLDIYVPYFSKLSIPIEELKDLSTKIEGFTVPTPESLLILKQGAEIDRKESVKGTKDQIDIMSILIFTKFDFKIYFKLLKEYKIENFSKRLSIIINEFKDYNYLNLTPREFKLKKKELVDKIRMPL